MPRAFSTQLLDMRPAAMLHVRLPFATGQQQPNRDSGKKGRAFCDRTNDSTRFAQPHRGGC